MSNQSANQSSSNNSEAPARMGVGVGSRGGGPGRFHKIEKAHDPRQALTRLLPYLTPFKITLILVLILVFIYTLLGLVGPYLMGRAIDQFISGKDLIGLRFIALLMLVVYVFNNLFQGAANWLMARVSQQALKNLRRDLFSHLQALSIGFFDTHTAGELMSRLTNDIDAINQAVSQNVTSLLASVLSLVGIIIAMFVLNHWLALATLLIVPIMVWFTNFIATYTRKGLPRAAKTAGRHEQCHGRSDQRAEGGQGLPAQPDGHRCIPRAQSGRLSSRCLC